MHKEDVTDFEDTTQIGVHGKQDMQYMRSLSAAAVHRTPRYLIAVVMIVGLFVAAAIGWANWAKIDVVIRGNGKVSPASQVQNIQSLEGGIALIAAAFRGALDFPDQLAIASPAARARLNRELTDLVLRFTPSATA